MTRAIILKIDIGYALQYSNPECLVCEIVVMILSTTQIAHMYFTIDKLGDLIQELSGDYGLRSFSRIIHDTVDVVENEDCPSCIPLGIRCHESHEKWIPCDNYAISGYAKKNEEQ